MSTDYTSPAEEYISFEHNTEFSSEMKRILDERDQKELADRFYKRLEFGTGGLRGKIGAGYNRMNPLVVKRATLGLARYLSAHAPEPRSVAIAYDSRRYSRAFAESAAGVLAANGIVAYVFEDIRPTPELSFAVRRLGARAGIVITASHNPPEYNGYKVYWSDGGQIVPPHDDGIIREVERVDGDVEAMDIDEAKKLGLYQSLGGEMDSEFIEMVKRYLHRTDLVSSAGDDFSVVYTPLHGTGGTLLEPLFEDMGIPFHTVPEQREPDGEFPTVAYPNPEESAAMEMAVRLGETEHADLVMGTDPDADRLGIAVPSSEGFTLVTGNQLGALLCDYIFAGHEERGTMPDRPVLVKTIVTSELQRRIADSYGARTYDVLTGFKYIGERIRQFEQTGESYVFGGEESYGYLVETEVRDKDSISAAAVTAEMALYCRSKGLTVLDYLEDLYRRFGYFEEILVSRKFEGESGAETMNRIMDELREDPPARFGGLTVIEIRDYERGTSMKAAADTAGASGAAADTSGAVTGASGGENSGRFRAGQSGAIDLPRSNVIQFVLEGGIFTARPSGTEPKIKFYASCYGEPGENLHASKAKVAQRLEAIRRAINELAE